MFGAETSRLVVRPVDYHEIHAALADDLVCIAYDDVPAAVSAPAACAPGSDLDFGANGYGAQVVQLLANPERAMAFGHAVL
jgi:predicted alpha/beta hydrolase